MALISSDKTSFQNFAFFFLISANSKKFKTLRKQNLKLWYKVQFEDVSIIEGMQEGRNSPAYNGGNFSPIMDNPTHHFHKWVATNIV